ncbi:hypothetical protein [Nonomuraea endophytica]|uniref:hypothetical protein n=1 Tax=Nonomuraea endophytica TaxID=714136 RepID=UPI0037CA2364
MKRIFAGVALTVAAAALTAAPAQAAAPKDPVVALKKQFVAGTGVKFVDRTILANRGQREIFMRRTGTFAFSKAGLAASDITGKFNFKQSDLPEDAPDLLKGLFAAERTIRVGTTSYISGGMFGTMLPEDKTWIKFPKGPTGGLTGLYGQMVNITEPNTLKTLLKSGKAIKGGYAGAITVGQLNKVSAWYRASLFDKPTKKQQKAVISWKLQLDGKGLPKRLVTTYSPVAIGMDAEGKETLSVDTRYTGWGSKVTITAPPADDVTTEFKDGTSEIPDGLTLPNGDVVAK